MSKALLQDSYLKQVISVVDQIYPEDIEQQSVYRDTTQFFINDAKSTREQLDLKIRIATLQDELADSSDVVPEKAAKLDTLINNLNALKQADANSKHARLNRVRGLCNRVIDLCEGNTAAESQQKTAKFLAALWMLAEQNGGGHQQIHQRLKAPYKLALSLRFADSILANKLADVPNWQALSNPGKRYTDPEFKNQWLASVAMPLLMASLFQDSGLQHPLSLKLIYGETGRANPFRMLDQQERQSLLKMNYRFSVDYVTLGLGVDYATEYATPEQQILAHATTLELVKDAYKPETGIGEIIKIPQIYASVVFSTKSDFNREDVPKGCILVDQLGKKGVLNAKLAQAFTSITGLFPQGFGLLDKDQKLMVYGLNPKKQHEPFVKPLLDTNGDSVDQKVFTLLKADNFYFSETRKQFTELEMAKIEVLVKYKPQENANFWSTVESFAKWQPIWKKL